MKEIIDNLQKLEDFKFSTISGLNEGEKYFLPYLFNEKIVVVSSLSSIYAYKEQLESLGKRVIVFEDKLPLLYGFHESKTESFKNYYINVSKLAKGDYDTIILSPESLFQKLPDRDFILNSTLKFEKNKDYFLDEIAKKLLEMGYKKQDLVFTPGDFSVRGDILDIFAVNESSPIRLSFFDTTLEQINTFDKNTFKPIKELNNIEVFLNSFLNLSSLNKDAIKKNVNLSLQKLNLNSEAMLRISSIASEQLENLEENIKEVSSVFFLPFCSYFNSSIFDFLPSKTKIIFDEPKLVLDRINLIEEENAESFLDLSIKGELLPKTMEFYFEKKEFLKKIKNFNLLSYSRLISQNKIFDSEYCLNFICGRNAKYQNKFTSLVEDVKNYLKNGYTLFLSCGLELTLKKVTDFLKEANVKFNIVENISKVQTNCINVSKQNVPYSANFEMEKFVLIGSLALNNQQVLESINKGEENKPKFLPQVGDYVVHQIHGIGKCLGIKNLKLTSASRDYIIVEYFGGDLLYLPCENADMLSSYVGESDPKCNKIGGAEFNRVKQKVKNSIKEMAFDLISVYSSRLNSKGFKFSKDTYLQKDFENAFVFPYTQDQLTAIKEIKNDMENGKIMDRLICGDVGFGKTEVALVAAFKAIQDGKQVAIISPTTILCEQHYNTALNRMKNFMVETAVINRFKTKKEQDDILKRLSEGKIDLICGTHRLFSKDVKFKDLGLIILDEEQRFGVEDKEKLKNIKKTVDVLSLSATPIPRTLYMSLVGIRDVSFLSTAPRDRKRIQTSVIEYSDNLLVDCCKKELDRGGQVLIVYNKVESITNFYAHVKSLLPEAKIGFAHGQMSSKELESAIFDLYSQKTQILISTVLIENGVDLPHANTLFVVDSDKLGLSQLYQLRGRIGRSDLEAYAYFSFAKNKMLTEDSYKRLDAIMEFSDFGGGYKIAMRDLEIRGAGDVLGKLQHGHMQQVGYEMYVKLLNEAVMELNGEEKQDVVETKIDISLNAFLPNNYISSNENRIAFYTKVSKIKSEHELDELLNEVNLRYGNVPSPVVQLCKVGLIKNLAQKLFIKNVKIDDFGCKITFYKEVLDKPIFECLNKPSVNYVLTLENLPIISFAKQSSLEKNEEQLINFLVNLTKENKNK